MNLLITNLCVSPYDPDHTAREPSNLFLPNAAALVKVRHGEALFRFDVTTLNLFASINVAVRVGQDRQSTMIHRAVLGTYFAKAYCLALALHVQHVREIRGILAIRSAKERVFTGLIAGLLVGKVIDFDATLSLTHEATFRALRRLVKQSGVEKCGVVFTT